MRNLNLFSLIVFTVLVLSNTASASDLLGDWNSNLVYENSSTGEKHPVSGKVGFKIWSDKASCGDPESEDETLCISWPFSGVHVLSRNKNILADNTEYSPKVGEYNSNNLWLKRTYLDGSVQIVNIKLSADGKTADFFGQYTWKDAIGFEESETLSGVLKR